MEIRGTFSELILQGLSLRESTDSEPMQLFVEDLAIVTCRTSAVVCNEAMNPTALNHSYERFRYVLMLGQVKLVLRESRALCGRDLTPDEACRAVMYYSENDAFLTLHPVPQKNPFVWKVGHRRGDG